MKRAFIYLVVCLVAPIAVHANCSDPVRVTSTTADFVNVGVADALYSISFEPDGAGSGTTATISLKFCSRKDSDSCQDYDFDTDADGLGDTNILDGSTIEKGGVKNIQGFRFLLIEVGTNPAAGEEPEYTVCSTRMK